MWQVLWGLFAVVVALMMFLKPGDQVGSAHNWPKLPTLTPTPSAWSLNRKLPIRTPTPAPTVISSDWAEWPVEISSVPIQQSVSQPPPEPSSLPQQITNFPSTLPGADSVSAVAPPAPSAISITPTPTPVPDSPLIGLPVNGRITQDFGCSLYYTGLVGPGCSAEQPWFHDGLDIEAVIDTPVPAMMPGVVIFAGEDTTGPKCDDDRGYGLAVVVDSGSGWRTLYAHLSKINVTAGQAVNPETIVGAVGASGCATGPHLHFGLRHNDGLVDPRSAISGEIGLAY